MRIQVQEKEAKLKQSEEELYARHREMKDALEKQRLELEEKSECVFCRTGGGTLVRGSLSCWRDQPRWAVCVWSACADPATFPHLAFHTFASCWPRPLALTERRLETGRPLTPPQQKKKAGFLRN